MASRLAASSRVLVYAEDPEVRRFIDHELFAEPVTSEVAHGLAEVIENLTAEAPRRAQILIVDLAVMAAADFRVLAAVRDAGWPGMVIAVGDAPAGLCRTLGIDRVVARALRAETLRNAIANIGLDRPTTKMRRLDR